MYILIVARGYPSNRYKMNGIFEFDQAKALARNGCKVVYLALDFRSVRKWRKWGVEHLKKDGVNIFCINLPLGGLPQKILHCAGCYVIKKGYERIAQKYGKPDLLHAHFTNIAYLAAKLSEKEYLKLIVTEHSSLINQEHIDKRLFDVAKFTYQKADKVIAVSPALKEKIYLNFQIQADFIPNNVDTSLFRYCPHEKTNFFRMVSTGNLVPGKSMDLLIQAFWHTYKEYSNIELHIFGDGPEKGKLKAMIIELGLQDKVFLRGACLRRQIADELQQSDCFILASQSETFGVAYIEALSVGVPVIATQCGGPECFVNDSNGVLIPVKNMDAIVESIKYMYQNISNYNRLAISNEIQHKFSDNKIAGSLINEYSYMLNLKGED